MFRNSLVIAVFATALAASTCVSAETWGPWSVNTDAPVLRTSADRDTSGRPARAQREYSIAATPFIWLLRLYQVFISPLDGDRCPMKPTCSQFSAQAIRKHGPFLGIIMTTDRLIHESDEQHYAVIIRVCVTATEFGQNARAAWW